MINNNITNSRMYGTTDILAKALDATWKRNEVIGQNIANIDTPEYSRKDVAFESYLNDYMRKNGKLDLEGVRRIEPKVYTDHTASSYRLDGNNVDIDVEMAYLAQNQLKYDTLTAQVKYNFDRLNIVLR
ncbi:MAG: flagellar basal body rod protein FlgB [Vallitaleaceae bacterium]|jgi:flagellar basal-body rod protein FlgB|nr:flagellar basal body rod protein FlgB [Vallitaleaceae bacterium]